MILRRFRKLVGRFFPRTVTITQLPETAEIENMTLPREAFEIRDVRPLEGGSWIPLRKIAKTELFAPAEGIIRFQEWAGTSTAAIEVGYRTEAEELGWHAELDVNAHRSGVESWGYRASDILNDGNSALGINLVIDQQVELEENSVWHLHPDLVVALDLVRDGDIWYRPQEGWVEVVRLKRDVAGAPTLFEIRSEFLRDYLTARGMALYCSSYHERIMVTSNKPAFNWANDQFDEESARDVREGVILTSSAPDPLEHFWTRGALWRTEWVEPGLLSTRVRRDHDPHTTTFILQNDGTRADSSQLSASMAWLYFDPALVKSLLRHRGGRLGWFTRDTGSMGATSHGVHFGVNDLGLITVFAKDIGNLATWEQRIWAAHNVSPDGGVSQELFAAQMQVSPASTIAPETDVLSALTALDAAFAAKFGEPLLRDNKMLPNLLLRIHRFVATDTDGLLELAKDLTRMFAERISVDAIVKAIGLPKSEKAPGSLKAVEKLIGHHQSPEDASKMMAPLFGIYDLRLADAHLGSNKIASGLKRTNVEDTNPSVVQGRQLLSSYVDTIKDITSILT